MSDIGMDVWSEIPWKDVTEIGFAQITVNSEEHAVTIRGTNGLQRIVAMTPNKGIAELLVELLSRFHRTLQP